MSAPKLTDDQKEDILKRLDSGQSAVALALEYGCHAQTIHRVRWQARDRALGVLADRIDKHNRLEAPETLETRAERFEEAVQADPLTKVVVTAESDAAICKNVTRELYRAFRAAGRDQDYRTQADIAKTIAAVVRARHRIAPPKGPKGAIKLYSVEASPDMWPDPPSSTEPPQT